jgi:murein DD-endopeptidase MepM/ murein hydrolase activator NlpD
VGNGPFHRFAAIAAAALMALTMTVIPVPPADGAEIYPIIFPVLGENHFTDTFDAKRSGGRTHEATDIMAAKMIPVVAAASGTVGWQHDEVGGSCCAMALNHDDGWASWYIHLNNDTPGTDDGLGFGFAPGVVSGAHVSAGQLIGWVGDSGNAEWAGSHLHFELHRPDGTKFNPHQ